MEIFLVVCDICKDQAKGTIRYTVATEDGIFGTTDRCEEHGAEFAAVIEAAPVATEPRSIESEPRRLQSIERADMPAAIARPSRGGRRRVVTLNDIEAEKTGPRRRR